MKERPILFNTAMVLAILSGRKTQTRRIAQVSYEKGMNNPVVRGKSGDVSSVHFQPGLDNCCPFGRIGDRLWVRETWSVISHSFNDDGLMVDWEPDRTAVPIKEMPFGNGFYSGHAIYRADGDMEWADDDGCHDERSHWKPSIHMPRSACRIILEITGLRVEHLHDISEGDALAEGIPEVLKCESPVDEFRMIWEQTGGDWATNPWIWVIGFKVLTTNGVLPEVAA